jgi:hypothetical protein
LDHRKVLSPDLVLPKSEKLPEITLTFDQALMTITQENLKKDLYYLAGQELEGRMSGKKGNRLAADYIEGKYKSFGLPTVRQRFPVNRWNPGPQNETGDSYSENVFAWIDGQDPVLKDEIVVIGAHFDHIGYGPRASLANSGKLAIHPGADDNGSGTVSLLSIANAFSKIKASLKRTVVFMSFSGEEMGLVGSKYYCDNPMFPKQSPSISKHVAMINLDMVGYLNQSNQWGRGESVISSDDLTKLIDGLNKKYSFAKSISGQGTGASDHASFYNKKIPVVFLHTGLHSNYHKPSDTPDKINYAGMCEIAKYGFELSWNVIGGITPPVFNHASFKEIKPTNDHCHPGLPFIKGD